MSIITTGYCFLLLVAHQRLSMFMIVYTVLSHRVWLLTFCRVQLHTLHCNILMCSSRATRMTVDCLPWQTQLHCAMERTPALLHLIILNYISISSPVSSDNNMMPFPIRGLRRHICPPRIQKVAVFCVCRLTDDGSQMVQCHNCLEWFHTKCVQVPRDKSDIPWLCASCR